MSLEAFQGILEGSQTLRKASKTVQGIQKGFKAFKGAQMFSMQLPWGFGGFWRASRELGSLPRASQRAPKAFYCSEKSFKDCSTHSKGFSRLAKAPKGSQQAHRGLWRLSNSNSLQINKAVTNIMRSNHLLFLIYIIYYAS